MRPLTNAFSLECLPAYWKYEPLLSSEWLVVRFVMDTG
jgi:hypothetical protein